MGRLIDQAIASKPAGIISTVPDEAIVGEPLSNAVATGIPVVIVNSGSAEIAAKIGALRYIGQAEYEAGKAAGGKAKAAVVKSFVCVSHFYPAPAFRTSAARASPTVSACRSAGRRSIPAPTRTT